MPNFSIRMDNEALIKKAKQKVQMKKDFFMHLGIYAPIMLFLFFINWMTSPDFWWAFFPLFGWGIGLMIHAVTIFGFFGFGSPSWESEEIAKEVERLSKNPKYSVDKDELELKERVELGKDWDEGEFV